MNEPSNGWNVAHYGVKQEGCSIEKGEEQSAMLVAMSEAMNKEGLSDIDISGCDETNDTTTNQAISKLSDEAIALLDRINTHTYSRNTTSSTKLYRTAMTLGKKLWMSEADSGEVKGENAGEMGAALNFAYQITSDLNDLQPSAWIMWQAIGSYCDKSNEFDPDTLDQKSLDTNGFWGVCYADMNNETVVKTKKYYAFGQYTKYIRPGDSVITTEDSCTIAAFNEESKQIKIVTYNANAEDRDVAYDLSAFANAGKDVEVIRTSGDYATGENWAKLDNLQVQNNQLKATIKGNSITTFVINGAEHDITAEINKEIDFSEDNTSDDTVSVDLAESRPMPLEKKSLGQICFASADWSYTVMSDDAAKLAIDISTMKNGSYSLVLPAPKGEDGSNMEVTGAVVFCVDLVGYAKYITGIDIKELKSDDEIAAYHTKIAETVKAKVTSVLQDGESLAFDITKVIVDDTEENGNLRIEFYNMYGPTAENGAVDTDMLSFSEELTINFDIELAMIDGNAVENDDNSGGQMGNEKNNIISPIMIGTTIGIIAVIAIIIVVVVLKKKKTAVK
ncbi:MAG: hypothetical protein E7266_06900 [Lachnospiraceae bacterium]|nr:hypothetical protein [Lachnospiraceae bacterium]